MPPINKPMSNRKRKDLPVKEFRSQDTLIEKSQVNHPHLDLEMEKILNDIVTGIRNCPPAQPKRKYQKSADIQSSMSRNIGSAADGPLLAEKQRMMGGEGSKSNQLLPKETPSLDGMSVSKQASERSEEGRSTHSMKSHTGSQHIQKVEAIAKQETSGSPRKETPIKDTNSQLQTKDSKEAVESGAKLDQKQCHHPKDKPKYTPNVVPYNPRKRHIGQGMKLMKIPPQTIVIDLDNDDPCPQQTKPQPTALPSTDPQ